MNRPFFNFNFIQNLHNKINSIYGNEKMEIHSTNTSCNIANNCTIKDKNICGSTYLCTIHRNK